MYYTILPYTSLCNNILPYNVLHYLNLYYPMLWYTTLYHPILPLLCQTSGFRSPVNSMIIKRRYWLLPLNFSCLHGTTFVRSGAEIGLLCLWPSISQAVSLGDFLLAPARDQSGKNPLEKLNLGCELNPGYGEDRQWDIFILPLSYHFLKNQNFCVCRLDWNLLSTASPAIDAWLNPSNRLATAVGKLMNGYKKRGTAIMACIMTDALDTPGMHFFFKVACVAHMASMLLPAWYFSLLVKFPPSAHSFPSLSSCLKRPAPSPFLFICALLHWLSSHLLLTVIICKAHEASFFITQYWSTSPLVCILVKVWCLTRGHRHGPWMAACEHRSTIMRNDQTGFSI